MSKVGGQRNYGYGKSLAWAGKNALKSRYGQGHFATQAAHAARWAKFAAFAKSEGIRDTRAVTRKLVESYAATLAARVESKTMSVRYAQNLVSTINVVLETMRGNRALRVRPGTLVGQRTNVRATIPAGLDRAVVIAAVRHLNELGHARVASVAELAREFGLRFREASLLDAREAAKEAERTGYMTVTRGTKGGRGRERDRTVPVTPDGLETLRRAATAQGNRQNLIPDEKNFREWRDYAYGAWRHHAQRDRPLAGFHDLRAAYACERYETLTRYSAPVVAGCRLANRDADRRARSLISQELGHSRLEVIAAYVGSAR